MKKIAKNIHYFYDANPYKSLESMKKFTQKECIYHEGEIAAFNKPPGFTLLGIYSRLFMIKTSEELFRLLKVQRMKKD
jgi:hypothetical protein